MEMRHEELKKVEAQRTYRLEGLEPEK
jgi:hypothetical protein